MTTGAPGDWIVYRGRPDRLGQVPAGSPKLEPRWMQAAACDALTRAWLDAMVNQLDVRSQPAIPSWFPIVARDRVFARTTAGIAAFDLKGGKLLWESASALTLDGLAAEPATASHFDRWVEAYRVNSPQLLLENSVIGTLSSDGRRVFAVEDLPLPPYPENYAGFLGKAGMGLALAFTPELTDAVYGSRLLALDAASGKILWERGGRTPPPDPDAREKDPAVSSPPLHDSFLLGPPLPLGDKLYLLSKKDQSLRLMCLDPVKGEPLWTQNLALSKSRMVLDGGRRLHAAHLAYREGILVCPTNAGAVIALELPTHSLLWAHAYKEEEPLPEVDLGFGGIRRRPQPITAPPNLSPEWKTTAPVLAGNRVVFAAPDDRHIHCLSLRDGRPLWKVPQAAGEQFLAGVCDGKVLVVGSTDCRALDLETGAVLWSVAAGLPAGQGVFAGHDYWLPIKASVMDRQAGLAIIDLDKGELRDFLAAPAGALPGNLLAHEGTLISQGLDGVKAFPLIVEKPEGQR